MATTRGLRVVNADGDAGEHARLLPVNAVAGVRLAATAAASHAQGAADHDPHALGRRDHGLGPGERYMQDSGLGCGGQPGGQGRRVSKTRLFLAELLGTFILMLFGIGTNAQSKFSADADGGYLAKMIGWGFAVAMVRGTWALWRCLSS